MRSLKKFFVLLGVGMLVMLAAEHADAIGVLFSRPLRSTTTYQKMIIKSVDADATVQDGIAVTHVDQVFFNTMNQMVEGIWVFPLPPGAVVTELAYWFNGQRYEGSVRERQEAVRDYENQIRRYLDPALLQYLGNNMFRLNIAPINPQSEVRFEITYVELLNYDFGVTTYKFLLNATSVSPAPLDRVSVRVRAETQSSFKFFRCPSFAGTTALDIQQVSDHEYWLIFGDEHFLPSRDLVVEFETYRDDVDLQVYTYTPVPQDSFGVDSFFALTITPPDTLGAGESIPKRVAFVADVSSSMDGQRIQELREALRNFLGLLGSSDKFNIIVFGTSVQMFRDDFVPATEENILAAQDFAQRLSAFGLTNMEGAFRTAFDMTYLPESENVLLFLTDGYSTEGITDPNELLALVRSLNTQNVRVFPFGIGKIVDRSFLLQLARENHGLAFFITADDSIALVTTQAFERMSRPVLMNLDLDIPGLVYYDSYPRNLPDLYFGSRITVLGRYINGGDYTVELSGEMRGETRLLSAPTSFPTSAGGVRAVAKLWANAKISDLLEQIALYGERPELVNAVVQLSLQFQILTPYTAFYSEPTAVEEGPEARTVPKGFALYQNYPNPFNATTEIRFSIPRTLEGKIVVLKIFDSRGRLVKTLLEEPARSGKHRVVWNGANERGQTASSGVYVCVLQVGEYRLQRKMILLR